MKTNNFLSDIYKAIGWPVNKLDFVSNFGFFMLQGLLAGIALNDIWRILQLPGENIPIVVGNQAQTIDIDQVYQWIIAGLVVIASAFGLKYGSGFGIGMALGSTLANQSEAGQTISLFPFNLPPKK